MARQIIGIGTTANDGTGDPLRTAFTKDNANSAELYAALAHPGIRNSFTSYYLPFGATPGSGTAAAVANTVYYLPFLLPGFSVDRIGIEVTTGVAGNCRLGLYQNNNGLPGALIIDGGTVSTGATGIIEASITLTVLPVAWVWAVAVFDSNPTCRICTNSNSSLVGSGSFNTSARGIEGAFTFAALPGTGPAPTGFSTAAPTISLRKS